MAILKVAIACVATLALVRAKSVRIEAPKQTTAADLAAINYQYTFEAYEAEFAKVYETAELRAHRRAAFGANMDTIKAHNTQVPPSSWTMGVNQFADMTKTEFGDFTRGRNKELANARQVGEQEKAVWAEASKDHVPVKDLPSSLDWRTKGVVTPVKNQGSCGSCWAFSTAETVESHLAIKFGAEKLAVYSEQELVDCVPNPKKCGGTGGCDGATQPMGFEYVAKYGIATEASYPYTATTDKCKKFNAVANVSGSVHIPANNYTALMNAVATVGPIAISAAAEPWQLYENGVFDSNCGADVDHAIQLVGYGTKSSLFSKHGKDYWLVRNSWGASWGDKGYILIERFGNTTKGETCHTDTTPGDGTGCAGGPSTVQVCGLCGIMSDSSYPSGGALLSQ